MTNSDISAAQTVASTGKETITCSSGYAIAPAASATNPVATQDLTCAAGAFSPADAFACEQGQGLLLKWRTVPMY